MVGPYPIGFSGFSFPVDLDSTFGPFLTTPPLRLQLSTTARFDCLIPYFRHQANKMFRSDSLAQIAHDDTPIGERPYPSGRREFVAPRHPAEVEANADGMALIGNNIPGTPGSWVITRSTASPNDPSSPPIVFQQGGTHGVRDSSSDIEVISSNFPKRRVVSRDIKPSIPATGTRGLVVAFTLYLPKGHDLAKGPPKKTSKPVFQPIPLPVTKQQFKIDDGSFVGLKSLLFDLASEVDNDHSKGNTAILELADASNKVKIHAFIARHNFYAKDHNRYITSDKLLQDFYAALPNEPVGNCGFTVTMENPAKAAQAASTELTKSQGRMRAQHTLKTATDPTTSDVAHAAPIPPEKQFLTALQKRHSSRHTDKGEGWRIFNPNDLTQKMELTYRHMVLWAEELAKGTAGVSVTMPPMAVYKDDFFWIEVIPKRPAPKSSSLSTSTTPTASVKRAKVTDDLTFKIGSYAEMQGHQVNINYNDLRRIQRELPIEHYFRWCQIDERIIDHDVKVLLEHGIKDFGRFLFPDVLDAKTVASWGILWDTAIELFTRAREYYVLQVGIDQEQVARRSIPHTALRSPPQW